MAVASDAETRASMPHGGMLEEAARHFPTAPRPFLDLSTGINPVPYPMPALPPDTFARLPEAGALARLTAAAAQAYGADPATLVAAPGTQVLIGVIPYLRPRGAVAVLSPTYGEHAACWAAAGHRVAEVATLAGCEAADVAVLCNPNNPDGRRTDPAAILALAARLGARGGLVVVDEAFADFEPGLSVAPVLPQAGLVVLRSFGKSYGLAGVRLGFALAPRPLAAALAGALGPWAVGGAALAVGCAALRDAGWRASSIERLDRDGARLDGALEAAGMALLGGTRLFRLYRGTDARALHARLGRAGILVRAFAAEPAWLRFGLPGDAAAWTRLDAALFDA
jgi:cobalamin biosynthetic protein CobC